MKKYIISLILLISVATLAAAQDKSSARSNVSLTADESYLILSTKRIQTMEKELDEAAAKGFRVLYGAPTISFDIALFLKRIEAGEGQPYTYKILATSRNKTMEKELNELAAQGYRLLPRTIVFKQGLFTAEMLTVLEREPDSKVAYEYKLIEARKEVKLQAKIDHAVAEGFAPLTMITLGENVIVMEKVIASKS
ncbi:MAG TPA: hypothetical protein VK308_09305 [Pyrinomonadaceae bacterium]|jgi:hypothetical protein|nr:hypothetical protein [Pyrinomonadaceae bacterium]